MAKEKDDSYLLELKNFVRLHAQAQQLDSQQIQQILNNITCSQGSEQGSWSAEWFKAAELKRQQQDWTTATRLFNLARFPFVSNPIQQQALEACVDCFARSMQHAAVDYESLSLANHSFKAYATGLDQNWPLLIVCGGIISIKEQWQRFLLLAHRLKICVVVTEMPGVGENKLNYHRESWTMFPHIIDALQGRADTKRTYLFALSFSGHLALMAAENDSRIVGITTIGAPVRHFFQTQDMACIPQVTRSTLCHLMKINQNQLAQQLSNWALLPTTATLSIPVHYLQSQFDEVIPATEVDVLRNRVTTVRIYQLPDIHGSPNHLHLVAPWALAAIMSGFKNRRKMAVLFTLLWRIKTVIQRFSKQLANQRQHHQSSNRTSE